MPQKLIVSIELRLESDTDPGELDERLTTATWEMLRPLVNADVVAEVSHVDVESQPEE